MMYSLRIRSPRQNMVSIMHRSFAQLVFVIALLCASVNALPANEAHFQNNIDHDPKTVAGGYEGLDDYIGNPELFGVGLTSAGLTGTYLNTALSFDLPFNHRIVVPLESQHSEQFNKGTNGYLHEKNNLPQGNSDKPKLTIQPQVS